MFFQFFDELRSARVPVTLKEYLALMDALSKDVIEMKIDEFYYLSRTALVKDERNLDKFDRVFSHVFKGLETLEGTEIAQIPEEWLRALTEKFLTEDEKKIEVPGWALALNVVLSLGFFIFMYKFVPLFAATKLKNVYPAFGNRFAFNVVDGVYSQCFSGTGLSHTTCS